MANKDLQVISLTSTRAHGSISNNHQLHEQNIKRFLDEHTIPYTSVHFMKQVHGSTVVAVDEHSPQIINSVDALVTDKPNIFLAVVTADCIPVTIIDRQSGVVAVAHAGYKGLLSGVLHNTLKQARQLGASTHSMVITLGARIGSCCYDIDEQRAAQFEEYFFGDDIFRYSGDKIYLSLSSVAREILTNEGIPSENVIVSKECTRCNNDKYFSFRGDSTETFGTFMSVVGLSKSV